MLLEYLYYFILYVIHILYKYKVLKSENQRKADKTIFCLMGKRLECTSQKEYNYGDVHMKKCPISIFSRSALKP